MIFRKFVISVGTTALMLIITNVHAASLTLKSHVTVQDLMPGISSANVTCLLFDSPTGASIASSQSSIGGTNSTVVPKSLGSATTSNLSVPMNNQEVKVTIQFASLAEMAKIKSYHCFLTLNDGNGVTKAPVASNINTAQKDQHFQANSGKPFTPEVTGNF